MITIEKEIMNNVFTKVHIRGLPFDAVLHRFTDAEPGAIHDHPFSFVSHVLKGGYIEKVYTINPGGYWHSELIHRKPGTSHTVTATCIHEIVELPKGECWTLILPGVHERTSCFWKFYPNAIAYRPWNSDNWQLLNQRA